MLTRRPTPYTNLMSILWFVSQHLQQTSSYLSVTISPCGRDCIQRSQLAQQTSNTLARLHLLLVAYYSVMDSMEISGRAEKSPLHPSLIRPHTPEHIYNRLGLSNPAFLFGGNVCAYNLHAIHYATSLSRHSALFHGTPHSLTTSGPLWVYRFLRPSTLA